MQKIKILKKLPISLSYWWLKLKFDVFINRLRALMALIRLTKCALLLDYLTVKSKKSSKCHLTYSYISDYYNIIS